MREMACIKFSTSIPELERPFAFLWAPNGMDVARALYLDLTGQPSVSSAAVEGRKWIVEDLDLVSSYRYYREGGLDDSELAQIPPWHR